MLLVQGFRVASTVFQNVAYMSDRLETWLPGIFWWATIPIRTGVWLLLAPVVAVAIVATRNSFTRAALVHTALVAVVTIISGDLLHRLVHIQSDQLAYLINAKIAFDRGSAQSEGESPTPRREERFDPIAATADYRAKSYEGVCFHNTYGAWYWVGETTSILVAYMLMVAAGYAVLLFHLNIDRRRQADRLQVTLHQLQYESLSNRLTPHFLYNSLNTISSLTLTDGDAARSCISDLGDLLRASLEAMPEGEIQLRKELEILGKYLAIQKTRFGDALDIRFEIEPGLESALVPAFLLQPLVENCFKHAFSNQQQSATVTVAVTRANGYCRIDVSDNGSKTESLDALGEKYGLGLTRQRLELQYGGRAQLTYRANHPTGLTVTASVPFRLAEAAEK